MEEVNQLAETFLLTKHKKDEQRRIIDFDLSKQLNELKKDRSTQGSLRVLQFKSKIEAEEAYYEELTTELQEIENDLFPILQEINANRLDPLTTHVKDRTYFDTFLNEKGEIISPGLYTKIS